MDMFVDLTETLLWSGWIKNTRPVSCIFVALPEHFKTGLLLPYKYTKGVMWVSDVTVRGLVDKIVEFTKTKKELNHIVVPDFLNALSRQMSTVRHTLQFLNSVIYEGTAPIKTHYTDFGIEVNCGLITAITTAKFFEKKKLWENIGFISRVIPVSYKYSYATRMEIANGIAKVIVDDKMVDIKYKKIKFPKKKQSIKINLDFANELKNLAMFLPKNYYFKKKVEAVIGFRLIESLTTLAKAHALKNKRREVIRDDVEKIKKYANFINFRFTEI